MMHLCLLDVEPPSLFVTAPIIFEAIEELTDGACDAQAAPTAPAAAAPTSQQLRRRRAKELKKLRAQEAAWAADI